MKSVVINIDDLRDRSRKLRFKASQYQSMETRLNSIMSNLQSVYKESGVPLVEEELNLTQTLEHISTELNRLANLLEERANQIESDYRK